MSNMYNMANGVNPSTFLILPMLGKHPDEYPRFRDCSVSSSAIWVLTRVGGGNRSDYMDAIQTLKKHPNYIKDYDAENDRTYAVFEFSIPEEWKKDFDLLVNNKFKDISQEYKDQLYKVFPKLKERYDNIFNK